LSDVLAKICATTRETVAAAKSRTPISELESQAADAPAVRDFVSALKNAPDIGLIAEVKKASPSAGIIRADFDPVTIAQTYANAGASCISCLTDEPYFQGKLEYLAAIRQVVDIPIMRKDFILDRYQVVEARAAGADCILLIAECLNDCEMRDLYFYASELGMECLIELYDPDNLDRVLKLDAPLVGINNRNLKTFETDLNHTIELGKQVPSSTVLVAESGIRTRADVEYLKAGGARAILVGETLMRQNDISAKVREMIGK
jgi:indole-3-glycerol phosphate synthase